MNTQHTGFLPYMTSLRKAGTLNIKVRSFGPSKSFGLKSLNPATVSVNSLFCVSWRGHGPLLRKCRHAEECAPCRAAAQLLLKKNFCVGPFSNSKRLTFQSMRRMFQKPCAPANVWGNTRAWACCCAIVVILLTI